jgi:hypothetical protein
MHLQVNQPRVALAGYVKTLKAIREDSSENHQPDILSQL